MTNLPLLSLLDFSELIRFVEELARHNHFVGFFFGVLASVVEERSHAY
jgi:hypothetical protein